MTLLNTNCSGIIKWEQLKNEGIGKKSYRSKIPGGWLFITWWGSAYENGGATFIPDPDHNWDGNSLE